MKTIKIIPVILALLVGLSAIGQEETEEMKTLFKPSSTDKISNGGYGSFSIGYTQIESKDAVQLGGRVAWIANHRFALGLAGMESNITKKKESLIEELQSSAEIITHRLDKVMRISQINDADTD